MNIAPSTQRIPDELMQRIVKAFAEKDVSRPCPRCGHPQFLITTEGFATFVIQPPDLSSIAIQGQNMPAVITTCEKCGFISLHSLVALGLISPEGKIRNE